LVWYGLCLPALAMLLGSCSLWSSSATAHVCVARDAVGKRVSCPAVEGSYPGDGCVCGAGAAAGKLEGVSFGRVGKE
jgi:hypothetical protein